MTYQNELAQNKLASRVQNFISEQPWGYSGNAPAPVRIYFNSIEEYPWEVKFVLDVIKNGKSRKWKVTIGKKLDEALLNARKIQEEGPND